MNKCLFLSNFHPFVTRNILDSGVLAEIAKDNKVILLVLDHKKEYFSSTYANYQNVVVEGIPFEKINTEPRNVIFERVADLLLDTKVKKYHKLVRKEKFNAPVRYFFETVVTKVLGHITFFKSVFRFFNYHISQTTEFDQLFLKYKPDVVFSTDIFDSANVSLINRARKFGIKTVGMTRSWDNTSTKVYLRTVPDKVIVQNEVIKEELSRLHNVNQRIIHMSGVPQFEEYLDYVPSVSREKFCTDLGLDVKKKIILVCPASGVFVDTDWQVLSILQKLYNEKRIPQNIQFLVRPHPYNDTDYSKFKPDENFVFESNLTVYQGARGREREEGRANRLHLADTLSHIHLMINTFSSIIVDAVMFDRPVISIGFDGWEQNVPFLRSLARWQSEECVVYFLSHGASPKVKNEDELAEWINTYLEHPEINREERKQFAEIHMWKLDGKSAERITKLIFDN